MDGFECVGFVGFDSVGFGSVGFVGSGSVGFVVFEVVEGCNHT